MRFYNKYWSKNYDELITYYPRFYREVLEMDAILRAHGSLADDIEDNIEKAYYNTFVSMMDDEALTEFENFLHIPPDISKTITERRYYVLGMLTGRGKLNETLIKAVVKSYTGGECIVTFEDSTVSVRILPPKNGEDYRFDDIKKSLEPLMPAHLGLTVERYYSTWGDIKNGFEDWDAVSDQADWQAVKEWIEEDEE